MFGKILPDCNVAMFSGINLFHKAVGGNKN